MPSPLRIGLTIDCPDPEVLATFWEEITGYRRRPSGEDGPYVTIERPSTELEGPPHITFQRVPEAKATKARAHLDLFVDHAAPTLAAMMQAGATLLTTTEAGQWTTRVLQDPAGNEFCLIGPD